MSTCTLERRSADALRALDLDVDRPALCGVITALVHDSERRLGELALFADSMDTPTLQAEVRCALRIADVAATLHGDPGFWDSTPGRQVAARAAAILEARVVAENAAVIEAAGRAA